MSKTLLNPEQSAAILNVTRPGFVRMVKRGEIEPELIIGRLTFFTPQAVRALKKKRDQAKRNGKPRRAHG